MPQPSDHNQANPFFFIREELRRLDIALPASYETFACAMSKHVMRYPVSYACCNTIVDAESAHWWRQFCLTQSDIKPPEEFRIQSGKTVLASEIAECCPFCGDRVHQFVRHHQLEQEIINFIASLQSYSELNRNLKNWIDAYLEPYPFPTVYKTTLSQPQRWQKIFVANTRGKVDDVDTKIDASSGANADLADSTPTLSIHQKYFLLFYGSSLLESESFYQLGILDYLLFPFAGIKLALNYLGPLAFEYPNDLIYLLIGSLFIIGFFFELTKFTLYFPIAVCVGLVALVSAIVDKVFETTIKNEEVLLQQSNKSSCDKSNKKIEVENKIPEDTIQNKTRAPIAFNEQIIPFDFKKQDLNPLRNVWRVRHNRFFGALHNKKSIFSATLSLSVSQCQTLFFSTATSDILEPVEQLSVGKQQYRIQGIRILKQGLAHLPDFIFCLREQKAEKSDTDSQRGLPRFLIWPHAHNQALLEAIAEQNAFYYDELSENEKKACNQPFGQEKQVAFTSPVAEEKGDLSHLEPHPQSHSIRHRYLGGLFPDHLFPHPLNQMVLEYAYEVPYPVSSLMAYKPQETHNMQSAAQVYGLQVDDIHPKIIGEGGNIKDLDTIFQETSSHFRVILPYDYENYLCPIGQILMQDPVYYPSCGAVPHYVERRALEMHRDQERENALAARARDIAHDDGGAEEKVAPSIHFCPCCRQPALGGFQADEGHKRVTRDRLISIRNKYNDRRLRAEPFEGETVEQLEQFRRNITLMIDNFGRVPYGEGLLQSRYAQFVKAVKEGKFVIASEISSEMSQESCDDACSSRSSWSCRIS